MKKTIYMLLPAMCLLASCTSNVSSSTNANNSTPASSNSVTPSSSSQSSTSSSVPNTVITASDLKDLASEMEEINKSDRFEAPSKAWLTHVEDMSYINVNVPESEDYNAVITMESAYDLETGYYYTSMVYEDRLLEMTMTSKVYGYALDTKYILASDEDGTKMYYEVECETNDAAVEFAKTMVEQMGVVEEVAVEVKGIASLQSLVGFVEQYEVNNDEDPSNDVTNDYDSYVIGITANSENENSFDATVTLDASAKIEDEGMVQDSSIKGVLEVEYVDGYLTHSLDEATMVESMDMAGEVMSMTIYSKVESTIAYSYDATYPDLSEFTLTPLE